MRMGRAAFCAVVTVLIVLAAGCGDAQESRPRVPLPRLDAQPLRLRVAHVTNQRLPQLEPQQLSLLLATARGAAKTYFGVDVQFAGIEERSVDSLFKSLPPGADEALRVWIYDFRKGDHDRAPLARALVKELRTSGDDLEQMIAYASPFLVRPLRGRTYEALADALVETQLTRLTRLAQQKMPDGAPLLERSAFSEVVYWDSIAYMDAPYEVIVTNQIMASADLAGGSVHSAIRGGITNGITPTNPRSQLQSTAIVSVYPFVGDDAVTRELRGGEIYAPEEAARFAGFLLAHELGHQLLHLGHPYGRRS